MASIPEQWRVFVDADMDRIERIPCAGGEALVFVRKRPGREDRNEDAALVAPLDGRCVVLVAADGAGGLPEGALAARMAVDCVADVISRRADPDPALGARIQDGLEHAHRAIATLGIGSATTANVVLIDGDALRSYHVGDSITLVVDGAGRCKLRTVPHSPVGVKLRDGLLSENQAIRHADLHLVHNLLGVGSCRVDPSAPVALAPGDTVIIATDGLFDNLLVSEVVELACHPDLMLGVAAMIQEAWRRMTAPTPGDPSKPDDLTVIAYRRTTGC